MPQPAFGRLEAETVNLGSDTVMLSIASEAEHTAAADDTSCDVYVANTLRGVIPRSSAASQAPSATVT